MIFYPRSNILRSPPQTRERSQAQPPPAAAAQAGDEELEEEVVEPLKKRMRGSVPMPVPPRPQTPPPVSPPKDEMEAPPVTPTQADQGEDLGDMEDMGNGAGGDQSDDSMSENTKRELQDMIARDEAQGQEDQAAQRAERRRAEEYTFPRREDDL